MRINGRWVEDDGAVLRPYIPCEIETEAGGWIVCPMLVDTGADRTVFSADILARLGRPFAPAPVQLGGVGGAVETLRVWTRMRLTKEDGTKVFSNGYYSAFSNPAALDHPVLGRDVLQHFALIVDYVGDTVCRVREGHRYVIQES
jgi:hypothetical protein